MAQEVSTHSSSAPLPLQLLWRRGWPPAAQFFWSKDKVTKLNNYQSEFKDLVDAKLPLRRAGDIGAVRRKLIAEYPHAVGAIDLVLRELREGKPVRWPRASDPPWTDRCPSTHCRSARSSRSRTRSRSHSPERAPSTSVTPLQSPSAATKAMPCIQVHRYAGNH